MKRALLLGLAVVIVWGGTAFAAYQLGTKKSMTKEVAVIPTDTPPPPPVPSPTSLVNLTVTEVSNRIGSYGEREITIRGLLYYQEATKDYLLADNEPATQSQPGTQRSTVMILDVSQFKGNIRDLAGLLPTDPQQNKPVTKAPVVVRGRIATITSPSGIKTLGLVVEDIQR